MKENTTFSLDEAETEAQRRGGHTATQSQRMVLTQGDMVGRPHSGLRIFWIFILTQELLTL